MGLKQNDHTIFSLQRQFICTADKVLKVFNFKALTNSTTSYRVSFFETDSEEVNAWIAVGLAVTKDYPNLKLV